MQEIRTKSDIETKKVASSLAKELKPGDIILLYGDLGAGKTVFTKGIVEYFSGGKDTAISPNFLIVNEYKTSPPIYHFDLYRINDVSELYAIGIEEYLFSDGISIVEWPERAVELFPSNSIVVDIKKINNNERLIKIERW